jgi:hypothetical protein
MSEPFAAISERLFEEFGSDLPLSEIMIVLRRSRDQLDIASPAMLPELLERLARERLNARVAGQHSRELRGEGGLDERARIDRR